VRFATYRIPGSDIDKIGVARDDVLFEIAGCERLQDLLGEGNDALREVGRRAVDEAGGGIAFSEVRLRAPVPVPPSVRDFLAFEDHVRNAHGGADPDPDWYELPVFYFSNPAEVRGPYDDVRVSPGSAMFDYELEVAAVVGRPGRNLSVEEAEDHICGYTVMCDFSARDLQRREMRQNLGPAKGKDGATSLGPWLVTPDEVEPRRSGKSFALEMSVSVNGRRYGGGRLDSVHWSFAEMISYASRGTRVVPGDVIGSGTVGTGCILEHVMTGGAEDHPWLVPGDVVELEVELLGAMRHEILPAEPLHPLKAG
jgi:2-keto-4-pentenoate hydratase/2-oxohepta-3-ene-1,7-dioic acid hydratase in catechol pathway